MPKCMQRPPIDLSSSAGWNYSSPVVSINLSKLFGCLFSFVGFIIDCVFSSYKHPLQTGFLWFISICISHVTVPRHQSPFVGLAEALFVEYPYTIGLELRSASRVPRLAGLSCCKDFHVPRHSRESESFFPRQCFQDALYYQFGPYLLGLKGLTAGADNCSASLSASGIGDPARRRG